MTHQIITGGWGENYNGTTGGSICVFQKNGEEYRLRQRIITGKSVSTLSLDAERKLLFVACETSFHGGHEPGGEIQVYAQKEDGTFCFINCFSSFGGFPIAVDLLKNRILVLNHGGNGEKIASTYVDKDGNYVTEWMGDEANLVLFERTGEGLPGKVLDIFRFHGHRRIPFFQETPSPHDLYRMPSGDYLVPVRGTDETKMFRLNCKKDALEMILCLEGLSGTGPRNAYVYGQYIYVLSEIEPVITVYRFMDHTVQTGRCSSENLVYEKLQEIGTLEAGQVPLCEHSSLEYAHPSGILIDGNYKKAYAITRSVDMLTVFDLAESGLLTGKKVIPLCGRNPRQVILKNGSLYILCQDTENIWQILLDQEGCPVGQREVIKGQKRLAVMLFTDSAGRRC